MGSRKTLCNINETILFRRLDEINGQLQDMHISAYKSDLLMQERDEIKKELGKRGFSLK